MPLTKVKNSRELSDEVKAAAKPCGTASLGEASTKFAQAARYDFAAPTCRTGRHHAAGRAA
jgi:hypothetical protein